MTSKGVDVDEQRIQIRKGLRDYSNFNFHFTLELLCIPLEFICENIKTQYLLMTFFRLTRRKIASMVEEVTLLSNSRFVEQLSRRNLLPSVCLPLRGDRSSLIGWRCALRHQFSTTATTRLSYWTEMSCCIIILSPTKRRPMHFTCILSRRHVFDWWWFVRVECTD